MDKVTSKIVFGGNKKPCPWKQTGDKPKSYRATLYYKGREMAVDFFTGSAHPTPVTEDVVVCLTMDASGLICAGDDFYDWSCEYGLDSSREHRDTFLQVRKQTAQLRELLGEDFDEFVDMDEEDVCARCA